MFIAVEFENQIAKRMCITESVDELDLFLERSYPLVEPPPPKKGKGTIVLLANAKMEEQVIDFLKEIRARSDTIEITGSLANLYKS